jgi:putative Holliday junction resolvase
VAERGEGPVLGLDVGDARIGVAVSDPERRVAVPIGTIRTGAPDDLKAVRALVEQHGAVTVVVGLPLELSGRSGTRASHAEAFAQALRAFLPGTDVVTHDERLTTVEAERALRDAGASGRRVRRAVDRSAAAVILQSYLDGLRRP